MKQVILLAFTSFLLGNTINVPADFSTIQTGLDTAGTGDTVLVASGTYFENIVWPATNGIKLIGENRETTIIDGDSLASVVRFSTEPVDSSTLIFGFTIQNGLPSHYGGGIYCYQSSPSLKNVTIRNNSASYSGGGIYCYQSYPSLKNVTIRNNSAGYSGGGIFCSESSLDFTNVTICENSASGGGGIYCIKSILNMENAAIFNNFAEEHGGGMYSYYSGLSLTNVTVRENSADYDGGGIFCSESSLDFNNEFRCNIYSNVITNRGYGSDFFSNSFVEVVVDTFTVMNPTDYYATPIDIFFFDILNSVENLINADLYVSVDGDDLNNTGTSVESPFKTIQHALERIHGDSLNTHRIHLDSGVYSPSTNGEVFPLKWSNFVNLSGSGEEETILDADGTAGVLKFEYVNDILIENLTITGGYGVSSGGGIYCKYSSPDFMNMIIRDNYTCGSGGGIYCKNSSPNLENLIIMNNSANFAGGGVFCFMFSSPNLKNVTIANNSAVDTGGGILSNSNSVPNLVNCILWNDSPQEIYVSSNSEINMSYSNIQGDWEGDGNIGFDPLFCDPENENYHLAENSPCIATGENGVNMGALGIGCESIYFLGDLNMDAIINVLDIVQAVGIVLGTIIPSEYQQWVGDMNDDGEINILDVVQIVNIALVGL